MRVWTDPDGGAVLRAVDAAAADRHHKSAAGQH